MRGSRLPPNTWRACSTAPTSCATASVRSTDMHTPGPWYAANDAAEDCPDHTNSGLALIDTGRTEDWPIARLVEWNNAHLIAAAPDLLAALKDLAGGMMTLDIAN